MLKLVLGVSRKVVLPNFSSVGASCQIEVEVASELLTHDPVGFHNQVQRIFALARQAVDDELAPFRAPLRSDRSRLHPPLAVHEVAMPCSGSDFKGETRSPRPATANQLRAISWIADRRQVDLADLLQAHDVDHLEALTITEASALISRLRAAAPV